MEQYLRKATQLEKKGEYSKAGSLYEIAGEMENAAKMYLRGGSILQAARIYENIKYYQKAADLYERGNNFQKAAELFQQSDNFLRAAIMYEKVQMYFNAAEMLKKAKKYLKAAPLYEKSGHLETAGDMWKMASKHAKAAKAYEIAYNRILAKPDDEILQMSKEKILIRIAQKGAEAYYESNSPQKAAEMLVKAKKFDTAGRLFEEIGAFAIAVDMYFKGGEFKEGLRLLDDHPGLKVDLIKCARDLNNAGMVQESAFLYERAEMYEDAAYQYYQLGELILAAHNFERAEVYAMAGKCYLEADYFSEAGEMFLKDKRYRYAAEAFLKAGDTFKALQQYEKDSDFVSAATLAEKLGDKPQAIFLLQQVKESSEDFVEATFRLAELSFETKEYDTSFSKFQELLKIEGNGQYLKEIYYYLGRIWELKEEYQHADECYSQVSGFDSTFRDVAQRLKAVSVKSEQQRQKMKSQAQEEQESEAEKGDTQREVSSFIRRRYSIEEKIGIGKLGTVFKAQDTLLGRIVSLKEIKKDCFKTQLVRTRMKLKIMSAAKLNHPNIVTIFDMGEDDETIYLACEYIEGVSLHSLLNKGKVPLHKILSILNGVLEALAYAHEQKVYHRNLTPHNILIGEGNKVKISDFGLFFRPEELASGIDDKINDRMIYLSRKTREGRPENAQDDILSVGQIMLQLLTGQLTSFPEENFTSQPWLTNDRIPERMKKVLSHCFSEDDNKRIVSAQSFAEQLKTDSLEKGTLFDSRYEIISEMGRGGMGAVFKAHDRVLKEIVALKTLRNSSVIDEKNLQRFKWEIKMARKISHPNVVRIHHLGYFEGTYYISMELIYGITLKEQIHAGRDLPMDKKLDILVQISDALGAVHSLKIIHRDVKPQNILLDKDYRVKLVDFGISRISDMQGVTDTGEVMGTPEYMAPEQIKKKIDHRSDIYSLGIVMYEFLTGELPFTGDSPISILMAHLKTDPLPPQTIVPDIGEGLQRIVLRCLEKSPSKRYQSMSELANDLLAFKQELKKE